MGDAREKAVERLAAILWAVRRVPAGTGASGVPNDPRDDYADRMWAAAPPRFRAELVDAARRTFDQLGLVAIDPAHVARVREVRESAGERCRHDDPDVLCDRCRVDLVLTLPQANAVRMDRAFADAVLAQLATGRP